MCGSDFENSDEKNTPDVLALLAVMRYFVKNDYEVKVVILAAYRETVNFRYGLHKLIENNLCFLVYDDFHDDKITLDLALNTNGIALSNDSYRDHEKSSEIERDSIAMNWLGIKFTDIPTTSKFSFGTDGDFIAGKLFNFLSHRRTILNMENIGERLLIGKDEPTYEMSMKRRAKIWSEEWKNSTLELLDYLIEEGYKFLILKSIDEVKKYSNYRYPRTTPKRCVLSKIPDDVEANFEFEM
ncbi:unnamed protein product [Caenorhabditis angaria]|uniref:RNase NYN domain-containing protein n=1 Tax=Caenorhabditis angaria TaxID=860376 RepID=A0A9P1IQS8_9PELO|nr:unnamed protein product [Caenorhabditis angaria]